jgi:hypothetical protein
LLASVSSSFSSIDGSVRVHHGNPEVGVAGLVVGNRLGVHVQLAFGGFHPEAW